MTYQIEYKSSVKKDLRKLQTSDLQQIVKKITGLKSNPWPAGSSKLKGSEDLFRIRHGDYRIIYQVKGDRLIILIIKIGHRRDVYRKMP